MRFPWRQPVAPDHANALVKLSPEAAVTLLDSGVLDEQILHQAPLDAQVLGTTLYADVRPFSYEAWKRRYNVS